MYMQPTKTSKIKRKPMRIRTLTTTTTTTTVTTADKTMTSTTKTCGTIPCDKFSEVLLLEIFALPTGR